MCKKNFIPISVGFCVIALQNYREILKKYRKKAITLEKKQYFKKLKYIWNNKGTCMEKPQQIKIINKRPASLA